MKDYREYILALKKCAAEHDNDIISFGNIRVSDLYRTTAELLEELSSLEKPNMSEIPTGSNDLSSELEKTRKNSKKLEKDFEEPDCISRKEVLKLFNRSDSYTWETALIKKKIEDMPPVTPTRKKGKWTRLNNTIPCVNCQLCGKTFSLLQGGNTLNFCPNCGAEMESEE